MERRVVWAIILMMVIAIAPAILVKKPARPAGRGTGAVGRDSVPTAPRPSAPRPGGTDAEPSGPPSAGAVLADTVVVSSPLYRYGVSTRGGRFVSATLPRYQTMERGKTGPVQLLPEDSQLLGLTLVNGRDSVDLGHWNFRPSTTALSVQGRPATLRLDGEEGAYGAELEYTFVPDEYRVDVRGRVRGVGPNGGLLLVGMGPRLAQTEADSVENLRDLALVTSQGGTQRTSFTDLEAGKPKTMSGPFEWAAIKSKYFVTAVLGFDSAGGRIAGVTATPPTNAGEKPTRADVRLSIPVGPDGAFSYSLYAGPMEYERLRRIGHDFDDVNPYGWPGFRTLIRFFAIPTRWLLVWMHDSLGLAYGVVLVVFGILVRLILWPLNQKAMRASMQMQAVQPLMKELQDRHKDDPQRLQQEMFKLYKEHNVNPFGGCWPMLLPMPVLFALFFVLQNSIELRGTSFLWLPDLSRPDPIYIIPLVMGVSMFALTKVGQLGMEPNPQMKMMLYLMPAMMTVLFVNFPSGLNLYYAVSNIASVPQQWLLARERIRRTQTAPPPAPPPPAQPKRKKQQS
ncbi:MAG TPA: membrane protein insertase YidC [Gemmatimonadales bacterium]|nr:membrane protein insertase YidC [Gemmatimonadales bacterium]